MSDKKTVAAVEKHYERRYLEAKSEMLKDIGPIVDLFVSLHEQCLAVANKHNVNPPKLTQWVLEQLPIDHICCSSEDEDEDNTWNESEEDNEE